MADEAQDKFLHDIHSEACKLMCKGILLYLKAQGADVPNPIAEDECDEDLFPGYSIVEKSDAVMKNFDENHLKECPVKLIGEIEINDSLFNIPSPGKETHGISKFIVKFTTEIEYEVDGKAYKVSV